MSNLVRSPFIDWSNDVASWMDLGECVTTSHPDTWFGDNLREINTAKTLCHACPVETRCLEWALETEEAGLQWGVWGGKSADERKEIRRRQRELQVARPKLTVVPVGQPRPKGSPDGAKCGSEYGARLHEQKKERACDRCRVARMEAKARRKARKSA